MLLAIGYFLLYLLLNITNVYMNKVLKTLLLLLLSLGVFAQSNLPSNLSTFNAFKLNPLTINLKMPAGYNASHTPIVSETWTTGTNGAKTSYNPTTTISGDTIKVSLTASQINQLSGLGTARLLIKFNGIYRLGADIKISTGIGVPSNTITTVNLPDIGVIDVNMIGDAKASQIYSEQAKAARDSTLKNQWTGKSIVWVGTSIPQQFQPNSYPEIVARKLGATVYNNSVSGSSITFFPVNGAFPGKAGLSGTFSENISVGAGQNNSYQNRILAYLDAPYNAQLVLIDHGTNDTPYLPDSLGDINSTRKSLFYGSLNSVITNILTTYPTVKIVLVTPPNKYPYVSTTNTAKYEAARTAILAIGAKWSIPVCDLTNQSGVNLLTVGAGKFSTDGLHPNVLLSNRLAEILYRFLLTVR